MRNFEEPAESRAIGKLCTTSGQCPDECREDRPTEQVAACSGPPVGCDGKMTPKMLYPRPFLPSRCSGD